MLTSPALRVLAILQRAASITDNMSVHAAFAMILALEPTEAHDIQDAVAEALQDLRKEVRQVDHLLKNAKVTDALKTVPISEALNLTSPIHFSALWRQTRDNHLRRDVLVAWEWIAFILPSEEDEVTEAGLQKLTEELAELEAAAAKDGVPAELRAFVLRQARSIREALRRYRVQGVDPLKEALSTAIGETFREAPMLQQIDTSNPASKEVFSSLQKTWNTVAKVTRDFGAMNSFYQLAANTLPTLKHWIHEAQNLLSSL